MTVTDCAFQDDAFQNNAFQVCVESGGGMQVQYARRLPPLFIEESEEEIFLLLMTEILLNE